MNKRLILLIVIALLVVLVITGPSILNEKEVPTILSYEVVKQEDVSFENTVRFILSVVVSRDLSDEELLRVSTEVVDRMTSEHDVNAIGIRFYENEAYVGNVMALASVDWAPLGNWNRANEVETGDYSNHWYNIVFS